MNHKKIRIAFIHVTGLSTGGTEQFLQRLAVDLPKNQFEVDFYFANKTAEHRKKYVEENGINVIKFECGRIVEKKGYAYAFDCNFQKVFRNHYDLIQLGTDGADLSFLSCIRSTPIIDSIHYVSGKNNRFNVARVMHISQFSKNLWIKRGGDKKRIVMISLPLKEEGFKFTDVREELGLDKDCFIYGMHQANRDGIFSDVPLKAYKEIENVNNAFVMMNGSELYRRQAKELGLQNVFFYDYVQDHDKFYSILKSLDVYAHGRKDGELNSAAIAEAMSLALPVITHPSNDFNGHLEVVKENGFIASNDHEYAEYMRKLEENAELRRKCGNASKKIFKTKYNFKTQMDNIIGIYEDVLRNPYPNKCRRIFLDIRQKVRNKMIQIIILLLYKNRV